MKKLFNLLGMLIFFGTIIAGVAYYLQKRGFINVSFDYDDKDGRHVTRDFDELVESTAGTVGDKVSEVAAEVKSKITQSIDVVEDKFSGITVAENETSTF